MQAKFQLCASLTLFPLYTRSLPLCLHAWAARLSYFVDRWQHRLLTEAYDTWIGLLDLKHKKTVLPDLFKVSKLARGRSVTAHRAVWEKELTDFSCARLLCSLGLQRTRSVDPGALHQASCSVPTFKPKRSRTPENKTRASAAFIPGQARQIRVVNGKVEVEKVRYLFVFCWTELSLAFVFPCVSLPSICFDSVRLGCGRQ